jgi:uncharacterized protein (DUF2249 family)
MISADTTIARLLEAYPQLVDVLASYDPHFARLRNGLIRRLMAPRVTVAEAARMAGRDAGELVAALRRAVGEPEGAADEGGAAGAPAAPPAGTAPAAGGPRPAALAASPEARHVHLDVRADIRRGDEPFARTMSAVKALADDQALELRAPFEPIPLYGVLARRGLAHWAESRAADDWSAWFYRDAGARGAGDAGAAAAPAAPRTVTLDVRGLEPPLPMVRVLERLDVLGAGEQLEVIHSRRPLFLYPQLDERGFVHETDELEPGVVRIVVRRGAA